MGNIKPVKKAVGSIIPIIAMSIAVCCEAVTVDMSSPNDKQMTINKVLSAYSNSRLPRIGTSSI